MTLLQSIDHGLLTAATDLGGRSATRDDIVFVCAEILPYIVILAAIWIFMSGRTPKQRERNQDLIIWSLGAALLSVGIRWLMAGAIGRVRPYIRYPELHAVFLPNTANVAFPSGHAFLLFTVTGMLLFSKQHQRWGVALLIVSLIVIVARVAAAVHYPSDVLGGALLGLALAYFVTWQKTWFERQLK